MVTNSIHFKNKRTITKKNDELHIAKTQELNETRKITKKKINIYKKNAP